MDGVNIGIIEIGILHEAESHGRLDVFLHKASVAYVYVALGLKANAGSSTPG